MSGGNAAAPPLLWPKGLIRPESEQTLVYLDFNQWIYLAKAAVGLSQGKPYEQALQQCRAAHADGRVIFPLSGAHYMEMAGVKDPAQRRNVAAIMEELSDFRTIVNRTTVVRLELDSVLTDYIAPPSSLLADIPLLGFGSGPAFGKVGGLLIRDKEGNDVTAETRRRMGPEFDVMMAEATRRVEREVLKSV